MKPLSLVIFGITSNLSQRYLIPALYDMEEKNIFSPETIIIGISRSPYTDEQLDQYIEETLNTENKHHKHPIQKSTLQRLIQRFHHIAGNIEDIDLYPKLEGFLEELRNERKKDDNRIYYLATYPNLYQTIFTYLKKNQMDSQKNGFVRIVIEKPIGEDLSSAKKLNKLLHQFFDEDQIYRLDHYLGKETLQNILTFRFGNSIFEPILNKKYIDHIQITASENYGIGNRGGYFDNFGMLKDVGQNHQLQMLAFATMEAPSQFTNEEITQERLKLLKSLKAERVVLGQYDGYKKEKNVNPDSNADTFYAMKARIKNKRFQGVPVYIRAGKNLKRNLTEISIVFKKPINDLFRHLNADNQPNILTYQLYPDEAVTIKIMTKKPGHIYDLQPDHLKFTYPHEEIHSIPDEHEKLIIDAIMGDQTFFNDAPEIEAQWAVIEPLIKNKKAPIMYKPGTWGPSAANELIQNDGRKWLDYED